MGSLKDEMRGVRDGRPPCEKREDGERPASPDGVADALEEPKGNAGQGSETLEDNRPENAGGPASDSALGLPGVCDNPDNQDSEKGKDGPPRDGGPKEPQQEAGEGPDPSKDTTTSTQTVQVDVSLHPSVEIRSEIPQKDQNVGCEAVTVPFTPGPSTPAPFGQHHMRTQVSLEVVQCQSVATSPMTPPVGGTAFFFPKSSERSAGEGEESRDAQLQVERRVEFCSVATSPMTPKTPFGTAFPEICGGAEDRGVPAEEKAPGDAHATVEDPVGGATGPPDWSKQQRMGSMDQDITILVTSHDNTEAEEEEEEEEDVVEEDEEEEEVVEKKGERAESPTCPVKPEMIKIDEDNEEAEEEEKNPDPSIAHNQSRAEDAKRAGIPESPAPLGCHNIRTQVSLEVVQCQSAATSPMTPPEGDQAFSFPNISRKPRVVAAAETRDAELQVGRPVELRNASTAPMTPRTPTATCFPEVGKDQPTKEEEEEKTKETAGRDASPAGGRRCPERDEDQEKSEEPVQEVSWDEKGMTWEVYGAVVEVAVLGSAIQKHLEKQVKKREQSAPALSPLSPAAPPLATGSAHGDSGKSRAGKRGERDARAHRRRRNPFRLLLQNMQQPHCCSKTHTAE